MEQLTIGEVARRTGLQTSAIRYYERIGLLTAPQRVNGRRRYTADVLHKIGVIQMARQAGFSIAEVEMLLHDFPSDAAPSQRWQRLATQKIAQINAHIKQALEMRALLEQTLRCQCSTLDECACSDDPMTVCGTLIQITA